MKALESKLLLFHCGLGLFSILPALALFLLASTVTGSFRFSISCGLVAVLLFQLLGVLYRAGRVGGALPMRLSYWTLKIIQSLGMLPEYTPEKMVVAMNNRKVLADAGRVFLPEKTLLLLPHCLQNHECPVRLTFDPDACRRCGSCPIGCLLDLRDRYGTHFAIASGGTSARRIVEDLRPSLIIAVACPIDLSLGILDVQPITTVGILNQWRSGPCFDTWVDCREVEAALSMFLKDSGN